MAADIRLASHSLDQLKSVKAGDTVVVAGMITGAKIGVLKNPSKNGPSQYVRCHVEDLTTSVEAIMWAEEYAKYKDAFTKEEPVFVWGKVGRKNDETSLVMAKVLPVDQGRGELVRCLSVSVSMYKNEISDVEKIAGVLTSHPGKCPVQMIVVDEDGKAMTLILGDKFMIEPSPSVVRELEALLGEGMSRFIGV